MSAIGRPDLLAGLEIPRLQLADVVGSAVLVQNALRHPDVEFALHVFDRLAGQLGAQVVVSGNVDHPVCGL